MTKHTTKQRMHEALYGMAESLHRVGAMDKVTMRKFEELRLPVVRDLTAQEIQDLRNRENVSQEVFAKYLNVTVHTIQGWEQGKKHPRGSSLKLLNMVAEQGIKLLGRIGEDKSTSEDIRSLRKTSEPTLVSQSSIAQYRKAASSMVRTGSKICVPSRKAAASKKATVKKKKAAAFRKTA